MVVWALKTVLRRSFDKVLTTRIRCMSNNLPVKSSTKTVGVAADDHQIAVSKFSKRSDLSNVKRMVVKLGSAVLTRTDQGGIALGRLASIVEQVAELHAEGKEVVIVSSGAVAFGRQRLGRELVMSKSVRDTIRGGNRRVVDSKSCAAVGQSGLMSLYESMFGQYSITTAQVLISARDLDVEHRQALRSTIDNLLALSIVPIVNTNDAAAPPPPESNSDNVIQISDNDSLAARLSVQTGADLLVLMSNVDGLLTAPPGAENSSLIPTYCPQVVATEKIEFGAKSTVGLGGMDSKVDASVWCLDQGTSVVICNGCSPSQGGTMLLDIVDGKPIGTFFTNDPSSVETSSSGSGPHQGEEARTGSRKLQQLGGDERKEIVNLIADLLLEREDEIMAANMRDVTRAKKDGSLSSSMLSRLAMSPGKIQQLAVGVRQVADRSSHMLGQVILRRQLAQGLLAEQVQVPIGVVLVIFESRPDCLPQIASLAIATGNGVVLKGGRESSETNKCLHQLVCDALSKFSCSEAAQLVETREATSNLIDNSKGFIDLIIPRGSSQMVRGIVEQAAGTGVPVLGHSEGVCHVYVDRECSVDAACRVVRDAKCDYPAACNAMETLLVHKDLLHTSTFKQLNDILVAEGVKINLGPRIASRLLFSPSQIVTSLSTEYSGLECCVEVVDGVDDAIAHIEKHGSSHTDTIVTNNHDKAEHFLRSVDSACVFHNASTRFADGQRMGLGAEVGVSTTRIHARGPVGAEGLLTYKWLLRGQDHTVHDFGPDGTRTFDHKDLPLTVEVEDDE